SNDHRLGANEAPPAIMSVYLGTQLEEVFEQIKSGSISDSKSKGVMDLGIDVLPPLSKDAGDRNRTSPFAFTGNRFEFRAVGSSQSVSGPLIALNTILADSLEFIANRLSTEIGNGLDVDSAILTVLKEIMQEHGSVVFGGNGYSEEWHKEAVEVRGLKNLPTTADALPFLKADFIEELFAKTGVLTPRELESRFEVYAEQYIMSIEVEAKLVIDMAKTSIYPAAVDYLAKLSSTITSLVGLGIDLEKNSAKKVAELTNGLAGAIAKLEAAIAKDDFDSTEAHMQFMASDVRSLMNDVRAYADGLESEVADEFWPLPTYQEMLFIR
ncbi:MAG: glutamine synthetase type III, partial [Cyanobacteria bacterium P01_H01_bin.15]